MSAIIDATRQPAEEGKQGACHASHPELGALIRRGSAGQFARAWRRAAA